jgi:hypothetical protein
MVALAVACGSSNGGKNDAAGSGSACTGGSACGQPCDQGNNLGIGRFCTANGGQCGSNNNGFIFCTLTFDPQAPDGFCTGPCGSDADCGSNAFCDSNGSGSNAQKGCVPMDCGGTPSA